MASRVSDVLRIIGRSDYGAGEHLYHAADGVSDGGRFPKGKMHKTRKALHKLRLRASGMTDDLAGSKEVDGALSNKFEQTPKK